MPEDIVPVFAYVFMAIGSFQDFIGPIGFLGRGYHRALRGAHKRSRAGIGHLHCSTPTRFLGENKGIDQLTSPGPGPRRQPGAIWKPCTF